MHSAKDAIQRRQEEIDRLKSYELNSIQSKNKTASGPREDDLSAYGGDEEEKEYVSGHMSNYCSEQTFERKGDRKGKYNKKMQKDLKAEKRRTNKFQFLGCACIGSKTGE